jgi:hypothetical protein
LWNVQTRRRGSTTLIGDSDVIDDERCVEVSGFRQDSEAIGDPPTGPIVASRFPA